MIPEIMRIVPLSRNLNFAIRDEMENCIISSLMAEKGPEPTKIRRFRTFFIATI